MSYSSMKKRLIIPLVFALFITSSCGTRGASNAGHKTINVAGSTSIQPYMEMLAEEYEKMYEGYAVNVQGGGSSMGVSSAASGTADIGMSSRSLKDDEKEIVSEIIIAKDGLAIVVHPSNPVTGLTSEQIRAIYTRKITNWSEVGGEDRKIHVVTREEGSGTRGAFEELVMQYKDADGEKVIEYINPKSIVQNTNGSVRQLVASDRYAIGYISLGLVEGGYGLKPVQALSIDGVEATAENVINTSYGLYRPFLIMTAMNEEPLEEAQHFIDFILSTEGQAVLVAEGLISVLGGGS